MFHLVGQGIAAGSDHIAPFFPRRGGGLQIGGLRFKDVLFQRPPQIEGTGCDVINERLIGAMERARRFKTAAADAIDSSLDVFLLANNETPELDWDSCIMLSAIAFERLLQPSSSSAQGLASAFANYWAPFSNLTISKAKRVRPDEKFVSDQKEWPLHRKWMKELYEARSAAAHRDRRAQFSQNWSAWKHLVIAAFAYPLTVKLRLAEDGFYSPTDRELGAYEAFDRLLDSNWGKGWSEPAEWSNILSMAEATRSLHQILIRAFEKHEKQQLSGT